MASNTEATTPPLVGIVMGSRSDWDTMQHAAWTR
jgi:5-(carboxyamino)imidazole ribonucleotide mutase